MQLIFWIKDRSDWAFLLSAGMAFSAAMVAVLELQLLHAMAIDIYAGLLRWMNLALFLMLISMVWFVYRIFDGARRWLALLITVAWSIGLIANFVAPGNLTFTEIARLERHTAFWGEQFTLPSGTASPWKLFPDIASLLILVYVADASVRAYRAAQERKALVVGGGIVAFILIAGVHTPLVDAGVVATPYMISFSFLAIVMAMTYELSTDAFMAPRLINQLRASETRWRTLLENVGLAVVGVGADGKINYVNPFVLRLTGYSSNDLLGEAVTRFVPDNQTAELSKRLDESRARDIDPYSRWTLVCASGDKRQLDWSSVRVLSDSGEFAGILSVGADITDQLQAQHDLQQTRNDMDRLARANMLGELTSALAHELNQPLAAILSNAQAARRFLESASPDLEEIGEALDDIIRDDKRAGEVIHGLRRILRQGEVTGELFDINDAAREVVELLTSEINARHVTLKQTYVPGGLQVYAGKVEIQQVIMNLLINALKAVTDTAASGKSIELRTSRDGDSIVVSVKDTGPGVAPDMQAHLFDAFSSGRAGGLGMGLAICRRLVKSHDGEISWQNLAGAGAEFYFRLPRQSKPVLHKHAG